MSGIKYDAGSILSAHSSESGHFVFIPAGGFSMALMLLEQADWRGRWEVEESPVTDEQFDIIQSVAAGIRFNMVDGEEMNELANAFNRLVDEGLELRSVLSGSGSAGSGCCTDLLTDVPEMVTGGESGITQETINALGEVVAGTFTDTGSNWPSDFVDRDEYDAAKCNAVNQLYRDFRTTLGGLQVLDLAVIAGSSYLLGSALFSTGGAFVGVLAVSPALPLVALSIVIFMLSFILLAGNIGIRLKAIAERLDRETFVCAAFEATTYEELKTALLDMVQDAHDLAITEGVFVLNELFEGKLLELVAVLVPNEMLETVLQGAAILVDVLVELPEDIDCATCGGDLLIAGTSLLQNPNMETDLSSWTQGVASSWTWESSPATVGRGRYNLGATGTMEQNFIVTQQMVDENWQYRLQLTVAGSGTGASVLFRLFDDSDSLLWTDTKTAGSTKTFDVDTDAIPITLGVGTYYVKAYVGPDDVMEYCDVTLKAGV